MRGDTVLWVGREAKRVSRDRKLARKKANIIRLEMRRMKEGWWREGEGRRREERERQRGGISLPHYSIFSSYQ